MKHIEQQKARELRAQGYSIKHISKLLNVAKSSASIWVRNVELSEEQRDILRKKGHYSDVVERRRQARLSNEMQKREVVILAAQTTVRPISMKDLRLIGTMLYWAEGGKTQRMVRFSNGDPEMIKIMMAFFTIVCNVPKEKFRAHIHIHPHLDYKRAERYWSEISGIDLVQFYKTYRKPNKSSQNKKSSLPHGVFDIYVLDSKLFLTIQGWMRGIVLSYNPERLKTARYPKSITYSR